MTPFVVPTKAPLLILFIQEKFKGGGALNVWLPTYPTIPTKLSQGFVDDKAKASALIDAIAQQGSMELFPAST